MSTRSHAAAANGDVRHAAAFMDWMEWLPLACIVLAFGGAATRALLGLSLALATRRMPKTNGGAADLRVAGFDARRRAPFARQDWLRAPEAAAAAGQQRLLRVWDQAGARGGRGRRAWGARGVGLAAAAVSRAVPQLSRSACSRASAWLCWCSGGCWRAALVARAAWPLPACAGPGGLTGARAAFPCQPPAAPSSGGACTPSK